MKVGFRKPSLRGRGSSRISVKRMFRHRAGVKVGSGWGFITNPKKFVYNKVYRRTTVDPISLLSGGGGKSSAPTGFISAIFYLITVPFRLALIFLLFFVGMVNGDKTTQKKRVASKSNSKWQVHIAGRFLRKDIKLSKGERLLLKTDPTNEHDKNAVKILTEAGDLVGFVSRQENREISKWLRNGRQAYGIVDKPRSESPMLDVYVNG